jgi:LPXTG-motif cell wall-anchored protein
MEKPDQPTDPGEKKLDPGCYTPGDFDGLRPDMPGKPQPTTLPDGTPVLVTLGLDGKIDKIEIDPGDPVVEEKKKDTPPEEEPIIPTPPSTPADPTPEPATTEILDDPAPLAGIMDITVPEEEFVIMDEDAPLGNLPQTGSTANAAMGAAGLMAAVFSLAGAGATLSKKEED